MSNPWFRMYSEAVDDEKLRLLAFEDRWHFVALLCLKCQGVLDAGDDRKMLERKIAVKLGLQLRELEAVELRLQEVGLIGENFQPTKWDERQFKSDSSAERVAAYRERQKRYGNVTVTAQETDTDTDTEKEHKAKPFSPPIGDALLKAWKEIRKAKRSGPVTEIVWSAIERESKLAGITTEQAITICCERGWQGFKASWLKDNQLSQPEQPKPQSHQVVSVSNQAPIDMKKLVNGLALAKTALARKSA